MPRNDHVQDLTVAGNISLSATTTILPAFTPARIAKVRIAGESGIPTIQAAVNDITTGIVFVPIGIWQEQVTTKSGVWIIGSGWGTIIKAPDGLADAKQGVIQFTSAANNVQVLNLQIDGNKSNQTAGRTIRGIYFVGATRCAVKNCYVHDTEDHGIHFSNAGTEDGNQIIGNVVDAAGLSDTSVGGSGIGVSDGINFIISDNHALNSNRVGIRVEGSGHILSSNLCKGNGDGGIVPVSSSSRLLISANHCFDNVDSGAADRTNLDGIRLVGIDDSVVSSNLCRGNDGSGVHLDNNCNRVSITGNVCMNNGQSGTGDGITIENPGTANTDISVSSNICADNQGTKTQVNGLLIANSSDFAMITNNILRGNKTASLSNTSSGGNITTTNNIT